MFWKQTNHTVPGKKTNLVKQRAGILSADQSRPGQRVFLDHFICSACGRRIQGHGIKKAKSVVRSCSESYCDGCLFVDASSGLIHVEFQSHLSSLETIQAVDNFERIARDDGIFVQSYYSDNESVFTSKSFREHLKSSGQVSLHSGAESHHQNGTAERNI